MQFPLQSDQVVKNSASKKMLNALMFATYVTLWYKHKNWLKYDVDTVNDSIASAIQPADEAYFIEVVSLIMIAGFVVYQLLPSSMASKFGGQRNDFLIFGMINYWFAINFASMSFQLAVFCMKNNLAIFVATILRVLNVYSAERVLSKASK